MITKRQWMFGAAATTMLRARGAAAAGDALPPRTPQRERLALRLVALGLCLCHLLLLNLRRPNRAIPLAYQLLPREGRPQLLILGHLLDHFTPQLAGSEHVGLVHRAQLLAAHAGHVETDTGNAAHFAFAVRQGVVGLALATFQFPLAAWGTVLDDRAKPEHIRALEQLAARDLPTDLMEEVVTVAAKFAEVGLT